MEFTDEGKIILEDNQVDRDMLANAVVIGEKIYGVKFHEAAEVDSSPRVLTRQEADYAVSGLADIHSAHLQPGHASVILERCGDNAETALKYSGQAWMYLLRIAHNGVKRSYVD